MSLHNSDEIEKPEMDFSTNACNSENCIGQAEKSARGMPWHQEPMKDVISCEKPRGAANKLRSGDVRMGKPTTANLW